MYQYFYLSQLSGLQYIKVNYIKHVSGSVNTSPPPTGVYVIGFSYPVVPKGKARIRVQISAAHLDEDIDRCVDAFIQTGRKHGVVSWTGQTDGVWTRAARLCSSYCLMMMMMTTMGILVTFIGQQGLMVFVLCWIKHFAVYSIFHSHFYENM